MRRALPWRAAAAFALVSLPLFGGAGTPAKANGSSPPIFDFEAIGAPEVHVVRPYSVTPLPADSGVARSAVHVNSQPLVISSAAIAYAPLGETALATAGSLPANVFCYSYYPPGPTTPAESSCGGPAQAVNGITVEAASGWSKSTGDADDPTKIRSESSVRTLGIAGGATLPAAVTIGSAASSAVARPDDDREVGAASTELGDIEIGGVLRIASITSSASVALGGRPGTGAAARSLAIQGAEVAGQAVTIDPSGIHAGAQSTAIPDAGLQAAVDQALAAAGVTVRTLAAGAPVISPDGTKGNVSSGALVVTIRNDPLGALIEIHLGESSVNANAGRAGDDASGNGDGSVLSSNASSDDVAHLDTGAPAVNLPAAAPPPPAPRAGVGAGTPTTKAHVVEVASDLAAHRVDWMPV